ncbi:MAG TPA: DUF3341 domain-containing protein [Polyangia bacterium]|jgi:hypothetical protein
MSTPEPKAAAAAGPYGLLAQFDSAGALCTAAEMVRDAAYTRWDAHSPFPVHGLDRAMGLTRSRVPWVSLSLGLMGATLAMVFQWWTSAVDYPLVISGKPLFSYPAFMPITFEVGVLGGVLGALLGMLGFNRLPQLYHALFRSPRFERVTDDGFFISVEADDPKFDLARTRDLLEAAGATQVEIVER